jgi:hypothetical protein
MEGSVVRGFKTQKPEYTPDPGYKPGPLGQAGAASHFHWAGGACLALLNIPTPRLRYVIVRARSTAERGEVGGLFVYEDAVTAQDIDDASEFDGEMVAQVDHRRPWALDRSPRSMPREVVPTLGADDFVVYARHGEPDPAGQDWAWGEPISGPPLSVAHLRTVVFIALRGLVPPALASVMVRGSSGASEIHLGYAGNPGTHHTLWIRDLQDRISAIVPGIEVGAIREGNVDHERIRQLISIERWSPAFLAGPSPWAVTTEFSEGARKP